MSYALSNYSRGKQKRKLEKKKTAMKAAQEQPPVNTEKKTRPTQGAPVSMTAADLQRQNREAAQKRKTLAIRIAWGFAIGLHIIGIIVGTIYFVRKTVLDMNNDKINSVVLAESKPQPKRRTPPRTTRKPKQPKFSKIRVPKGQSVTTSAKIPMGNARFTLPANDVPTRPVMALKHKWNRQKSVQSNSTTGKYCYNNAGIRGAEV